MRKAVKGSRGTVQSAPRPTALPMPGERCTFYGKPDAAGRAVEILVDGKPRSYRDTKSAAIDAAEFLHPKEEQ
jgi:hypothetical protein